MIEIPQNKTDILYRFYKEKHKMPDNFVKYSKKALVAMSGGVDSAVSALLTIEAGYEAHGATMSLVAQSSEGVSQDILDAKAICDRLGIPHEVLRLESEFRKYVISEFVNSYIIGETPNPCVICNKNLKFGLLLDHALKSGYDTIVTGHYANIKKDGDRYLLCRASDPKKDQSYVMWMLTQSQLSHIFFPLGDMTKSEVRDIAEQNGFNNAHKHDSQDICFIPDGDYIKFIKEFTGKSFPKGNFLDVDGNILGWHEGIINYTPGQRKGLGIAFGKPMYVKAKDAATNTVTLCENESLFSSRLTAHAMNLITLDRIDVPIKVYAKIRYNHTAAPATVLQTGDDSFELIFDEPQRAIAKGQSAVLYDGDVVIGGGFID